jgi:hypothetical protein
MSDAVFENVEACSQQLTTCCVLGRHRSDMCCRYLLAGRGAFYSESMLSISVDAARIGKLNRMLVAIAKPDGTAMWAPPQAIASDESKCSKFGFSCVFIALQCDILLQ